ncbi:MAG: PilZ domain-containing protein [Desulfobacterales bacterium]|nr:PilZ domain-containing protein [Desulfobacterales bacterium]
MDYIRNSSTLNAAVEGKKEKAALSNRRLIDSDFESEPPGKPGSIGRNKLVNILNLRHFRNQTVQIHFQDEGTLRNLSFEAIPQPCFGKHLVCLWKNPPGALPKTDKYRLTGLSFSNGTELIHADALSRAASSRGICLTLPGSAVSHSLRVSARYKCESIHARMLQNGVVFEGLLKDFNFSAFCVMIPSAGETPFQWLNYSNNLTLILKSEEETLYSGECRIIENPGKRDEKELVIEPVNDTVQRFSPRIYRSKRVSFTPAPDIIFTHPLTGGHVSLKAIDISGAGISVEESRENAGLFAGLILPEMTINFASAFNIQCKAQVAYTRVLKTQQGKEKVKCGIAFLDMEPNQHMRLLSMIHQAENSHLYICNPVDIDSLWGFFFETGFIYPRKYAFIQPYKEEVKKTYEKLYNSQSPIARYFTWQQNGTILAHLAMLRFYEKTWLIHHLASRTERRAGTGIDMIDQVGEFAYETHRLASSQMSYMICYYRPANRFSAHFFGGVAKNIKNLHACSVDEFAYYHSRAGNVNTSLPGQWSLSKAEYHDLCELKEFYDQRSGGLMIKALDLIPEKPVRNRSDLSERYHEIGLRRERRVFTLRKQDRVKAVIMANISDFALNLSDLTNCLSIFVIDQETPYDIVRQAVSVLQEYYAASKIPVLIYPLSYAENTGRRYERVYSLWAMNMQYTDEFFKSYNALK